MTDRLSNRDARRLFLNLHGLSEPVHRKLTDAENFETLNPAEADAKIKLLEGQMYEQAKNLDFESAARTRDQIAELRDHMLKQ